MFNGILLQSVCVVYVEWPLDKSIKLKYDAVQNNVIFLRNVIH